MLEADPADCVTGYARTVTGRGQVIQAVRDPSGRQVYAGGSDLRGDGHVAPQI